MHCPNCGQQQVSKETKFCSRCGLPLSLVSEVLVHGGHLPQLAQLDKESNTIFTRKNGMVFSLFWFIFFVPFMASVFGGVFNIEVLGEIFALVGVFGSMLIFIFSLAYLKKTPKHNFSPQPAPAGLYGQANPALPPQQSIPVSAYQAPSAGSWRDTNDLQPASITENTTKLLEKDEAPQ